MKLLIGKTVLGTSDLQNVRECDRRCPEHGTLEPMHAKELAPVDAEDSTVDSVDSGPQS